MVKISYVLLPITFYCWYRAWQLNTESLLPLNGGSNGFEKSTSNHPDKTHEPPPLQHTAIATGSSSDTDPTSIGADPNNIFYFIHVSDIHVSMFNKHGGIHHLRWFLNTTIPHLIKPAFVLATGDLTDAKDEWKVGSEQHRIEWTMYREALREAGILDKPGFWWDQRGNHDCFNVVPRGHSDMFREMSRVKDEQYSFEYKTSFGQYAFISLDACPVYGLSRPFNFFGYFDSKDLDFLQRRLNKFQSANHTFVMSHYPITSTLTGYTSSGLSFEQLSREFSVFLCGHLHKLAGGLGDHMHAYHESDFLELEVADLKTHGAYRIFAIDHDFVSFVDASILPRNVDYKHADKMGDVMANPDPVVLITNPKDARYTLKEHEPISRIKTSTHIRFLVFSISEIASVLVVIDGVEVTENRAIFVGDASMPLWSLKWNAKQYDDGETHELRISVTDTQGNTGEQVVQFRLDGYRPDLNVGPGEHILHSRISYWIPKLFIAMYLVIMIVLLLLPKLFSAYLHKYKKYHRWRVEYSRYIIELDRSLPVALPPPEQKMARLLKQIQLHLTLVYFDFRFFLHATVFRLVTLASLPTTFYPLYCYGLYIVIGPFFIGELVPSALEAGDIFGAFGSFYLYGIYIERMWLPMTDTWVFGFFELLYLFGPLVIYLSFCITPPEQIYAPKPPRATIEAAGTNVFYYPPPHNRRRYPLHRRLQVRLLVVLVVMYQLTNVFFICLYYGPWAMVLSPGKTWFCVWAIRALYKFRWSARGREVELDDDDGDGAKNGVVWVKGVIKRASERIKRASTKVQDDASGKVQERSGGDVADAAVLAKQRRRVSKLAG